MEEVIWVSPSKLELFASCKWAYWARYILKLPDPGNSKTHLGSLIHEIFELLDDPAKLEFKLQKRKKLILWSIENQKIHPVILKLYQRFVIKYKIPEELQELGTDLMLDAFLRGYDVNYPVLAVEQEFKILLSENVGIRGYIDKIIDLGDVQVGACEAKDYKTGMPFSPDECKKKYQPYFYTIAIKKLFKFEYILFSFHFLKNHKTIHVDISEEELKTFKRYIIAKGIEMKNLKKETATCTKNWKCAKFCAFKNPNKELNYGGCPLYYNEDGSYKYQN